MRLHQWLRRLVARYVLRVQVSEEPIRPHERTVATVLHASVGVPHMALHNLEEARQHSDSYVVFEGDWGGQIYLTAPIALVRCASADLERLLREIDGRAWPDQPEGARVYFERIEQGNGVPGGMGGGRALSTIWIHPMLEEAGLGPYVTAVLSDTELPGS
jgi:hypothetical protein